MLTREPPIYVVCPGRVFRTDEYDATHSPVFHQVEGLVVDEGITMAHLRGHARPHARGAVRRGHPHPVPPVVLPVHRAVAPRWTWSASSAAASPRPSSPAAPAAARAGSSSGGCGVVNPRVLIACGVDPERYTGFAFGFGIDRMLMFRHGIEDLRDMFEGDVRFTTAFGTEI